jgi:hypothetical protein
MSEMRACTRSDGSPNELLHSAALTYLVSGERTFGTTLEVQNLTNERAYDFIGVQKPGRAYYFKATFEL